MGFVQRDNYVISHLAYSRLTGELGTEHVLDPSDISQL